MTASSGAPPHIYVLTSDEPLWERLSTSLIEAGLPVRRASDTAVAAAPPRLGALLIDRGTQDVDGILGWLREAAGSRPTLPLFVLAEDAPPRETYLRWLDRGIWDVIRLPLEEEVLNLRLANILRPVAGGGPEDEGRPTRPYGWAPLIRAVDETLALARRSGRTTSCLALSVRSDPGEPEGVDRRLSLRVAGVALDWTRRSDLVGTDEEGNVLLFLPDTPAAGAEVLLERLSRSLGDQFDVWGVRCMLEGRIVEGGPDMDGETLLRTTLAAPVHPLRGTRYG